MYDLSQPPLGFEPRSPAWEFETYQLSYPSAHDTSSSGGGCINIFDNRFIDKVTRQYFQLTV